MWCSLEESNPGRRKRRGTWEYVGQRVRYVLIKRDGMPGEDLKKVTPFTISKVIESCAGKPANIKKLRDGTILVECHTDTQSGKLLKLTNFTDDIKIKAEPHGKLNYSKGVIRSYDLMCASETEILLNLKDQKVESVKQIINTRKGGATPNYILTFSTPHLPKSVTAGYLNLEVRPYIPNPLRCFRCLRFGHITNSCSKVANACRRCCSEGHDENTCPNKPFCVNCNAEHEPLHPKCPVFLKEKEIKTIQATKKITLSEARKLYDAKAAPTFLKSFAQTTSNGRPFVFSGTSTNNTNTPTRPNTTSNIITNRKITCEIGIQTDSKLQSDAMEPTSKPAALPNEVEHSSPAAEQTQAADTMTDVMEVILGGGELPPPAETASLPPETHMEVPPSPPPQTPPGIGGGGETPQSPLRGRPSSASSTSSNTSWKTVKTKKQRTEYPEPTANRGINKSKSIIVRKIPGNMPGRKK